LAEALTAHVTAFPPVQITLPWGRPDGPSIEVRLLFSTTEGQPLDRWAWSIIWRETVTRVRGI